MAKSLIMAKYVREQKYMRAGMKNRKSPNRGLIATVLQDHCSQWLSKIMHAIWLSSQVQICNINLYTDDNELH